MARDPLSPRARRILSNGPTRDFRQPAPDDSLDEFDLGGGQDPKPDKKPDKDPVETLLKLLLARKDAGIGVDELAKFEPWVIQAIESRGHAIGFKAGRVVIERDHRSLLNPNASAERVFDPRRKKWRFLLISDSHFGGRQAQPWFVRELFEEAARRGCSAVFDCGDYLDGSPKMHAGMLYELVLHSADEQVDYVAQIYGECQLPIFGIGGNHPGSWFKDAGLNTSRMLAERCDNYTDLGPIEGWVAGPNDDPNFILLFHPHDGSSYAISYKPQKLAEYLVTENRRVPTGFCGIGHYHKRGWFTGPNGAQYFMVPSTGGTTPFMRGKKLVNESGAYFIEFGIDKHGKVDQFTLEAKNLWPSQWRPCDYSDFMRRTRPAPASAWE